jgi:hypothetical protein
MSAKILGVALLLQLALFVSLFGQGGRFVEGQITMQSGETLSGYVKNIGSQQLLRERRGSLESTV